MYHRTILRLAANMSLSTTTLTNADMLKSAFVTVAANMYLSITTKKLAHHSAASNLEDNIA